jgi:hypothetical protein
LFACGGVFAACFPRPRPPLLLRLLPPQLPPLEGREDDPPPAETAAAAAEMGLEDAARYSSPSHLFFMFLNDFVFFVKNISLRPLEKSTR